jgi:Na+/proline symporter
MKYLSITDYSVILCYCCFLAGLGLYLKKRASRSIEDYFLGGRALPWWALGISGMASFLDLTGTMVIVSFLFMMGPRGLFVEFRGGAVLVLAVMMLWSGKWHRRSGCITNAEWMIYRFGNTPGGHFARIAGATAAIASNVTLVAYLIKGTGLFISMFLPISPQSCAILMIGLATLYILTAGFYGVVYTDILQSVIILAAVILVCTIAFMKNPGYEQLASLAYDVTGQSGWMSSSCSWKTSMPKGYEQYSYLFVMAAFYLFRNVFYGMGAGGEPRYFGAKNDRECGKLTFLWTSLMMIRWPMMIGFAILGLFMVSEVFPDQAVLGDAALLIKTQVGAIDKSQWAQTVSMVVNSTDQFPSHFIEQLNSLLGENWRSSLYLLSYEGTIDPERILPAVLLYSIPRGFRGLILIALIAASLSTFGSLLNWTTGFFTKDVYQAYVHPAAENKELIQVSWAFGFIFVAISFLFAYSVKNINDIWDWFIMALGGGLVVPNMLRFYWWRFNGGGFAIGTLVGLTGAVLMRFCQVYSSDLNPFLVALLNNPAWQFFITMGIGLAGSVVGTYLTKPTHVKVVEHFYQTTRPFGFWSPLVRTLSPSMRTQMKKEHRRDVAALPFALAWQITLFLLPMQLLLKSYRSFMLTLPIFLVAFLGLYIIWLRYHVGEEAVEKTNEI